MSYKTKNKIEIKDGIAYMELRGRGGDTKMMNGELLGLLNRQFRRYFEIHNDLWWMNLER
jgi:hypothetical protein